MRTIPTTTRGQVPAYPDMSATCLSADNNDAQMELQADQYIVAVHARKETKPARSRKTPRPW